MNNTEVKSEVDQSIATAIKSLMSVNNYVTALENENAELRRIIDELRPDTEGDDSSKQGNDTGPQLLRERD
jgi:hypothetical protein